MIYNKDDLIDITYEIVFFDFWHIGSGSSGGKKTNNLVKKDKNLLPIIPGKTLKGLVREYANMIDKEFCNKCFGVNDTNKEYDICYFTSSYLQEEYEKEIVANRLQPKQYQTITHTSIENETQTSKDNSLRDIEVTIPITLYAKINNVPKDYTDKMQKALKMVKRMGMNRNRGLGRCTLKDING